MKLTPIRIAIGLIALLLVGVLVVTYEPTPDYSDLLYEKPPEDAESVFFVGNSHSRTSYVLPMLQRIAHHDDRHPPLWIGARLPGGWTLAQHVQNETIRHGLADHDIDYVVIQGQSLEPLLQDDLYLDAFQLLADDAHDRGAQPVLFQTWPRHPACDTYRELFSPPTDPLWAHNIKSELADAAVARSSALLAPVGRAWESVRTSDTPLNLYSSDHNHANRAGAYLTALVLYGAITDDLLPPEPWSPPDLSSEDVEVLIEVANQSLE